GPPLTSGSAACAVPPAASTSPSAPTPPCSACAPTRTPFSPSPSTWPSAPAAAPPPGCVASASTPSCASLSGWASTTNSSTPARGSDAKPNGSSPARPGPSSGKKDKHCDHLDPNDAEQGSYWDHVLLDPETRLIGSLVVGKRNADPVVQVFPNFGART